MNMSKIFFFFFLDKIIPKWIGLDNHLNSNVFEGFFPASSTKNPIAKIK